MAFPTNPTNGQQSTINGIVYTYSSSLAAWAATTTTSGNITGNNLTVTNQISSASVAATATVSASGNVTGGNLVTLGTASVGAVISTANVTGANLNATSRIMGGVNTYTKAAITNGGVVLDNGTTDTPGVHFYYGNATNFGIDVSGSTLRFVRQLDESGGTVLSSIDTSGNYSSGGNINPASNGTVDLGSASLRWRNIFTSDLHLNNGIGNWTIVEGEDDLFLHNNRNGKVYKFALKEVDPAQSPPKQKAD